MELVNLADYGFSVDPRYFRNGWTDSPVLLGRRSAVEALASARAMLPPGWNFLVWDMHRTREVQIRMIRSFREKIRTLHPGWPELAVMREVYRFAAKARRVVVRLDCHRNGGAADLTIVDSASRPIEMGTDHDDLTEQAAFDYFERREEPTEYERLVAANRRVLRRVLEPAGFSGLPSEWWHWSTVC